MLASIAPDHQEQAERPPDNVCFVPVEEDTSREPAWTRPLELADAQKAMREVEQLVAEGAHAHAVLHLRVIERAMPRIADHVALRRGELLRKLGMPWEAREAFRVAERSIDRNVSVQAQIGSVYCLLEAAHRTGESELQKLLRRYPMLSEREHLRFKLALSRKARGNTRGAITLLREIDLRDPSSSVAKLARDELARLAAEGVKVQPLSPLQRVERAERLLRWSPADITEVEIGELLEDKKVTPQLRARAHVLMAKLARLQGDWARVDDELSAARRKGLSPAEMGGVSVPDATPREPDEETRQSGERRIRAITRRRPLRRLSNFQLRTVVEIAAQTGLKRVADDALDAMRVRKTLSPATKFDAAIRVSGLASDEKIAALLKDVKNVRRFRLAGTYHYARALERLGQLSEAEEHYQQVRERDKTRTRYYAMWSDLRLWAIKSEQKACCLPHATPVDDEQSKPQVAGAAKAPAKGRPPLRRSGKAATSATSDSPGTTQRVSKTAKRKARSARAKDEARRERIAGLLEPVVQAHGEAYPWLARALDLVHLSLYDDAADELNEVYMAWRDARGSPRLRAGIVTVFSGRAPPRRFADYKVRRARLAFSRDDQSRQMLSEAATLIGDPGVGLRFGHFRLGERPRAYSREVARAAERYGIDPNLLFAVMRVESIYNRRIVSNAGAVGLMQIMPVTGKRIADHLGVEDFKTTDLLSPRTNLEFSAWYLASLIERFDGRLPLAIASYNGGPHNVRLWMRKNYPDMPLDAFLERIPFSQTHRYVRRVLTHYAAYRAQQDLPMPRLHVDLPSPRPDPIAF